MRRVLSLICCLATALALSPPAAQTQADRGGSVRLRRGDGKTHTVQLYKRSYALIIGNSEYAYWTHLPGVRRDVEEVAAALRRQGFTVVSFDARGEAINDRPALNLTREEFRRQVELFTGRYGQDEDHRLLIYYAGHGYTALLPDERRMGYLVMRDAPAMPPVDDGRLPRLTSGQLKVFKPASIQMTDVEAFAEDISARHALFVFDSCFAGTVLFRDGEVRIPSYLNDEVTRPVRAFLTAGNEYQRVPDESIFRQAFVRGIQGAADAADDDNERDGYVLASELAAYIRKEVAKHTSNQTPTFGKILKPELARGDFVFVTDAAVLPPAAAPAPSPAGVSAGAPPTPALGGEAAFWATIQNSNDPGDFDRFLEAHKDGIYAPLARFKRDKLRAAAEMVRYRNPKQGMTLRRQLGSDVWMEFVGIPAGSFAMGSPSDEQDRYSDEGPQRTITFREGFWMGKYEVTVRQWEDVMKERSIFSRCDECPAQEVSWLKAKEFLQKLNERNDGFEYRLPSEAEWEYAARANTRTRFYWGDDLSYTVICSYANVLDEAFTRSSNFSMIQDPVSCDDRYGHVAPVGRFAANHFGLHDMIGSVPEWCEDIYSGNYKGLPSDGSANVSKGEFDRRVQRGGSYLDGAGKRGSLSSSLRSAARKSESPGLTLLSGFRVVAVARAQ